MRQPRAERVRDTLLDVALRLRPERTRQRRARLASHRPHKRIVRTVAPVVVVRVAARPSRQPRDGTERREEPRARLPLLRPSLRIPELGDDGVEILSSGDRRARARDCRDAPDGDRPPPLVDVPDLRQHAIPHRLFARVRVEVGARRVGEHGSHRGEDGVGGSAELLTAVRHRAVGKLRRTHRGHQPVEQGGERGGKLGLGVAAQDHAGVRVHRARSHLGDHLRG